MPVYNPTILPFKNARKVIYTLLIISLAIFVSRTSFSLDQYNDFDLSNSIIPVDQIFHGGPERDGIPSINNPKFIPHRDASFLADDDRILGLFYKNIARAYPIKILNYHEIVNDKFNNESILITYCPLCGSGIAFSPKLGHNNVRFGVSGLLYNSDMLLYDRKTESLWSQIMAVAISGKLKGKKLDRLVMKDTTWRKWKTLFPKTHVLSTDTGYSRNYQRHPYGDYDLNSAIYFPLTHTNKRYHAKEKILAVEINNKFKAYPFSELAKTTGTVTDLFAGKKLQIKFDAKSRTGAVYHNNKEIPATTLFWFAWVAFHPDTDVFSATKKQVKIMR